MKLNNSMHEHFDKVKVEFLAEAGSLALEIVRLNAPVNTGAFRDSLRPEVMIVGNNIDLKIVTDSETPQLVWVTGGTSAHTIQPSSARVLAFTDTSGASVFAALVNHPGTQPNDFDRRSMDELLPLLVELLDDKLKSIA